MTMMPLRELLRARGAIRPEVLRDLPVNPRICKPVRAVGRGHVETAMQLVLAAGAPLEDRDAARDAVVDRVMQADVEVKQVVLLDATPVAAEKVIGVLHVEGAGDGAAGALGHDQL